MEFSPEQVTHQDGKGFLAVPRTRANLQYSHCQSHKLSELQPCTHHLFCVLPLSPSQWKTTFPQHRTAQFILCFHADTASAVHPLCLLIWEYGAAAAGGKVAGPLLPCWFHYMTHTAPSHPHIQILMYFFQTG